MAAKATLMYVNLVFDLASWLESQWNLRRIVLRVFGLNCSQTYK